MKHPLVRHPPSDRHLFLDLEILKRLMRKVGLPQYPTALRTRLGTEREQAVDTGFAPAGWVSCLACLLAWTPGSYSHLVIAWRDE
jgi:hypothetical protein